MILELHKAFSHIKYYDEKHQYFDTRNGKQLISVTTWLKQFQQEFKSDYWSKKKATERGISQEEMLSEWTNLKNYGTSRGSYVHLLAEHLSNGKYFKYDIPPQIVEMGWEDKFNEEISILGKQVENFIATEKPIVIKNELILGNENIAGQCDLLCSMNDKVSLIDYKTDKSIDFTNKYQKLKHPFNTLDDCNMSKYQLQLSTYKRLLESNTSIRIEQMFIVHFNKDNDNYKMYPITEYQWQQ